MNGANIDVNALIPQNDKAKAFVYILIVVAVIGIALFIMSKVFGGFDAILIALGLKKSAEQKALDEKLAKSNAAAQTAESPWSPSFYKNAPAGTVIITNQSAKALAQQIWDSIGVLYDTPAQATAAIKQLPTQAALSYLADIFQQEHNRDLYDWLQYKLDTSEQKKELANIVDYVNNLPKYIK